MIKHINIELEYLYIYLYLYTTTVIGQKGHVIEIFVNTIHMYSSYGLLIIGIPSHDIGRIRDYRCMKWKSNSVYI